MHSTYFIEVWLKNVVKLMSHRGQEGLEVRIPIFTLYTRTVPVSIHTIIPFLQCVVIAVYDSMLTGNWKLLLAAEHINLKILMLV